MSHAVGTITRTICSLSNTENVSILNTRSKTSFSTPHPSFKNSSTVSQSPSPCSGDFKKTYNLQNNYEHKPFTRNDKLFTEGIEKSFSLRMDSLSSLTGDSICELGKTKTETEIISLLHGNGMSKLKCAVSQNRLGKDNLFVRFATDTRIEGKYEQWIELHLKKMKGYLSAFGECEVHEKDLDFIKQQEAFKLSVSVVSEHMYATEYRIQYIEKNDPCYHLYSCSFFINKWVVDERELIL